ncbi:MAG: cysteine desulfurase family protein [Planctomycetota bacterium]
MPFARALRSSGIAMTDPIYLDYNATTPLRPEVLDAMRPWFEPGGQGNPSSTHPAGRRARAAIDAARAHVAAAIGAQPDEIVFTGGGTEASNIAIIGSAWADDEAGGRRTKIVTSTIEHPATSRPCELLATRGREIVRIPVDSVGCVRADNVAAACGNGETTLLVSIMHSNNETGALQPIADVARRVKPKGVRVHTDAAQSLGKVPLNVDDLGVDLLTIAGHKLYAPKGVGALYARRGTPVSPVLRGAGHERGLRPGTENVPYIVALGEACRLVCEQLVQVSGHLRAMRDRLWARLSAAVPGLVLNGPAGDPSGRLPNTLSVRFPRGASGNRLLAAAPGVAASTGSACHEGGAETASAVILAMGVPAADALGTVRLSVGHFTTGDEADRAADELVRAFETVAPAP